MAKKIEPHYATGEQVRRAGAPKDAMIGEIVRARSLIQPDTMGSTQLVTVKWSNGFTGVLSARQVKHV